MPFGEIDLAFTVIGHDHVNAALIRRMLRLSRRNPACGALSFKRGIPDSREEDEMRDLNPSVSGHTSAADNYKFTST